MWTDCLMYSTFERIVPKFQPTCQDLCFCFYYYYNYYSNDFRQLFRTYEFLLQYILSSSIRLSLCLSLKHTYVTFHSRLFLYSAEDPSVNRWRRQIWWILHLLYVLKLTHCCVRAWKPDLKGLVSGVQFRSPI